MKAIRLLAVLALVWPMTAFAQARESGVDPAVRPGDDFFAFANGGWLRATAIPAGKDRWGARDEIAAVTHRQVQALLDGATGKVAAFRASLLNASPSASLAPALDSIARCADKAALVQLLGRSLGADVDPLNWGVYRSSHVLGLSVEPGIHGEPTYLVILLQGGLGLPDRENYLSADSGMRAQRAAYQQRIGRVLAEAGFDRAVERAAAVMALETAMAQSQATREASNSESNAEHRWTHPDFNREAPGMNWHNFFTAAGIAGQDTIIAWQPGAMKGLAALVASEPLETWKDYLRFHLLDGVADVVQRRVSPDSVTQSVMGDAIGRMYAEHYFPARQKARVQRIVADVTAAFTRQVEAATWLSPASKAIALAKIRTLYVGIGYPERWQGDSDLVIDPADAVGNLRRVADWRYRHALALIGKRVDPSDWWIAPQTPGAILAFQQNAYDFSAALLQDPKYDSTESDAAAYGSIGAIIGHDVSHFVDVLGADYDTTGAERHWWTAEDMARFQAAAQPLVDQFAGYRPFPDLGVNGMLTRTENVADLAGLSAAFDAYRHTLGDKTSDRAFVRQQDRRFFIAWARGWRVITNEQALRTQLAGDHAPERYRVNTVRNLDAWYEAFDVRPGQRLYLEPRARVRVW